MLIRNKTDTTQHIGDVHILPWRDAVVDDGTVIDGEVFEVLDTTPSKRKVNLDLNNDGSFDKADVKIAAQVMQQGKKIKKQ